MPVRIIKKSGSSIVGSFPSTKMGRPIRFESTLERDFIYLLEFSESITYFEEQPMTVSMRLSDGLIHTYTPDFFVVDTMLATINEIKPSYQLCDSHTIQQIEIGKRWADENNYVFRLFTEREIRLGTKLENIKLLFRYSQIQIPFFVMQSINEVFLCKSFPISFIELNLILGKMTHVECGKYLLALLYHHYLETNMDELISSNSPISKTFQEE